MRTFGLVLGLVVAGVLVPTAAAQYRANIVSWPTDVGPGEPVSMVLTLGADPTRLAEARARPRRQGGVALVIRGNGRTRRFATEHLGSGRYRAELVFPEAGAWRLAVQYRLMADRPGEPANEVPLGKSGFCVGGFPCDEAPGTQRPAATGHARFAIGVAIAVGAVLTAAAFAALAARRRSPRTA